MKHYDDIPCLPECDERHAEDCPRDKAEMEYYRAYFGVGTPAFWNFRPEGCDCDGGHNPECELHGRNR
jgi:hypothetical protein